MIPFIFHLPGTTVGTTATDPKRQRGIMAIASSVAFPAPTIVGGELHLLRKWESDTPANFGGDGHHYWTVWYVVPKEDEVSFSGTSGVLDILDWFMAERDLSETIGLNGSGVAVTVRQTLSYSGSQFGFATESTDVTQSTRFGELMYLYTDIWPRSIDDVWNYYTFHHADRDAFDHDNVRHNMTPQPNDFMLSDPVDDGEYQHQISMRNTTESTADEFPGACRVLVTQMSVKLRGLCPVALIPRPRVAPPWFPMGGIKPPPLAPIFPLGDEPL